MTAVTGGGYIGYYMIHSPSPSQDGHPSYDPLLLLSLWMESIFVHLIYLVILEMEDGVAACWVWRGGGGLDGDGQWGKAEEKGGPEERLKII